MEAAAGEGGEEEEERDAWRGRRNERGIDCRPDEEVSTASPEMTVVGGEVSVPLVLVVVRALVLSVTSKATLVRNLNRSVGNLW